MEGKHYVVLYVDHGGFPIFGKRLGTFVDSVADVRHSSYKLHLELSAFSIYEVSEASDSAMGERIACGKFSVDDQRLANQRCWKFGKKGKAFWYQFPKLGGKPPTAEQIEKWQKDPFDEGSDITALPTAKELESLKGSTFEFSADGATDVHKL